MLLAACEAETPPMTPLPPAVTCLSCRFAWCSATMADGLRLLGSCPRCRGVLDFALSAPGLRADPVDDVPDPTAGDDRPPHLVLGLPRR
jgi:hypothetical protein